MSGLSRPTYGRSALHPVHLIGASTLQSGAASRVDCRVKPGNDNRVKPGNDKRNQANASVH
jgi:hypothetical protein